MAWFVILYDSVLVLKMRFQIFSLSNKKVQGFSSDRKILMSLLLMLFHLQNLYKTYKVHYVPEIKLIS